MQSDKNIILTTLMPCTTAFNSRLLTFEIISKFQIHEHPQLAETGTRACATLRRSVACNCRIVQEGNAACRNVQECIGMHRSIQITSVLFVLCEIQCKIDKILKIHTFHYTDI